MNYQLVICKTDSAGIGNTMKGFITALSISDNVYIECNPAYMLGNYNSILDDKYIFDNNVTNLTEFIYSYRFLVLKDEAKNQLHIANEYDTLAPAVYNPKFDNLFSNKVYIDWNYNSDMVHSRIKERIFRAIDKIVFKPIILNYVDNICNTFKDDITLGISIRTWKGEHEHNINRPYSFDTYKAKIMDVLSLHPQINKFVISIDNSTYIREYVELFNTLNRPTIIIPQYAEINSLQHAIIKVLVLAKCNYFIGNRISTFSELVFWFSKHRAITYTVF